ncbi:hypothetical protein ABID46_001046 [Moheibacter stercoris]|uniref:Uncharacterized protein n=1 Tax=Moheibacter stercoris TaxID=1628251 RepID=A0ABV2LVA2_9FLAO
MNLYYRIWADCLNKLKDKEGKLRVNSLLVMSLLTSQNFLTIFMILVYLTKLLLLKIDLDFKYPKIGFFTFLIYNLILILISSIFHYCLIFLSGKHKELLKINHSINEGIFTKYFFFSSCGLVATYIILKLIKIPVV